MMAMCERIISTLDPKDGGYFPQQPADLLPADATAEQLDMAEKALTLVQSLDPPASRATQGMPAAAAHGDMLFYEEAKTLITSHWRICAIIAWRSSRSRPATPSS